MPQYKLTYFDVKALGEPIRLILSYAGKEFEDNRIKREDWPQLKSSSPFGKLPTLEIDGKVIHQSTAICRFLAKEAGLLGKNEWENLQIDQVVGALGDLASEISRMFRTEDLLAKEKLKQTIITETVPFYFNRFDEILENGGGYLANGRLSWADFYIVGYCESTSGSLGIDLAQKYHQFKALKERLYALPGVKEWVQKRPVTIL